MYYVHAPYRLLESAVEGMRIDVVDRRCRVSEREVSELSNQISSINKQLKQLEGWLHNSINLASFKPL